MFNLCQSVQQRGNTDILTMQCRGAKSTRPDKRCQGRPAVAWEYAVITSGHNSVQSSLNVVPLYAPCLSLFYTDHLYAILRCFLRSLSCRAQTSLQAYYPGPDQSFWAVSRPPVSLSLPDISITANVGHAQAAYRRVFRQSRVMYWQPPYSGCFASTPTMHTNLSCGCWFMWSRAAFRPTESMKNIADQFFPFCPT